MFTVHLKNIMVAVAHPTSGPSPKSKVTIISILRSYCSNNISQQANPFLTQYKPITDSYSNHFITIQVANIYIPPTKHSIMDTLTEQLAAVSFIDNISAPDASLTLINESEDESLIMMQKNPAEVAIRTVGHTILSFLPIRDVFTSYLTITTNTFQQVKQHYLYRYHTSTNARNKVSHNKLNSRDAFVLTAILDHMLWQADSSDITRLRGGQGNTKGSIKPSKRDEEGYGGPINFRYDHNHRPIPLHRVYHHNDDYSHVIAMMLQLFHTHPLQYLYGVYDRFYYVLFNHCNDFHPILLAKMKDVLVKEVQYWGTSRVFGTFIVLFEREDGTILISLEDNKVYLATTILGVSFSQLVAVKTVQIKKKSATDLAGGSPVTTTNDNKAVFGKYNPLKGKKIACMLYPFQDMIVTDGSIWKTSTATESEINAALRIYIQAEDERSINTTLPKVEYIETRTLDPNEIQQVKETHGTTLEMLKRLPSGNDEEGIWVFDEEIR